MRNGVIGARIVARYDNPLTSFMGIRPVVLFALVFSSIAAAADKGVWVATWGASPAPQLASEEQMQAAKLAFRNQTLREIIHTSIAGRSLRVRLSNAYGKQTLEIGAVHIALHGQGPSTLPGSDRPLTVSGHQSFSIPPNAMVLSDPIQMDVPAGSDLVISIFVPGSASGAGIHYSSQQTSYVGMGDLTSAPSMPDASPFTSWVFLTGVDVLPDRPASTLVAFGDSITDGAHSSVDANQRWPNLLADRLLAKNRPIGVLDAGIGGNRILHDPVDNIRFGVNALARFDRDVLAQAAVKYVIVLEGINDLGHAGTSAPLSETVSAQDLIGGLLQMIERCHEKGSKIFGGTLTPFEGTTFPGYFTPEKEVKRKAVNEWIRTGHAFDGVIDFDRAVQDPNHPDRMLPAYDSGDHLHPNDAGYKAMAAAIDLALFR